MNSCPFLPMMTAMADEFLINFMAEEAPISSSIIVVSFLRQTGYWILINRTGGMHVIIGFRMGFFQRTLLIGPIVCLYI